MKTNELSVSKSSFCKNPRIIFKYFLLILILLLSINSFSQSRQYSQIYFSGIGMVNAYNSGEWTFTDHDIFVISDLESVYMVEQYTLEGQFRFNNLFKYYKTITNEDELYQTKGLHDDQVFEYVYKDVNTENAFLYTSEKLSEMTQGLSGHIRIKMPDNTIIIFYLAKPSKNVFQKLLELDRIE